MRHTLFTLASVTACFGIVGACTQDFDTFTGTPGEGGTGGSSGATSTSGGGGSSGATSTSGGGSSGTTTSSGGSSGGSSGAPVDCQAVSGSCYQQAQPCNAKCQTDHTACTDPCPNGNQGKQCRADCDAKRTTCLAACKTTCEQCAGPQCSNLCP